MSSIRTSILTLLLGSFFVAVLLFTGDKSSRSKSLRDKNLDDLIYSPSSDDSTSASSVVTKNIQSVNNNNNNNIPTAFSTQIASTKQIIIIKEQKVDNDDQQDEESQQQQPTLAQISTPPPSPVIKINTKQESTGGSASSNSEVFSSPSTPKFNNSYISFSSFPSDAYAVGPDHKYPQLDGGSMKRLDDSTKQKLAQLPRARFGWKQRLNTPTWVGYQLGYWWIIDCWHHRVLYRKRKEDEGDDDLDAERDFEKGWKSLKVANASWMVIPHSLVTDGKSVIMIESSINGSGNGLEHSVLVFEKITDLDHPLRKFGKKLKNNEINREEYQIKRQKNLHFDKWKKQKLERNKRVESPPPPPVLKSNILKTNSDDQSVVGSPPSVSSDQQQQPEIPNENTTFYDEFGDNYDIASALSVYDDDDDFILVQRVLACIPSRPDIRRPHRLVFDSEINSFFLWLTSPGALSRFNRLLPAKDDPHSEQQRQLDQKYLENFGKVRPRVSFAFCKVIPFMAAGGYARTIALTPTRYGPQLLISLGPNLIHRIAHRFIDRNTDPESIQSSGSFYHTQWRVQRGSMNDVFFHDGYWYITQTNKCAIHRQRQLTPSKLMGKVKIHGKEIRGNVNRKGLTANMKPDMLKKNFPLCRSSRIGNSDMCQGGGVPYFMSTVGKRIYMTYIFGCSGIVSFVPTVDLDGGNGTGTNIGYMPGYVGDVRHHFEKAGWIETLDDLIARGLVW